MLDIYSSMLQYRLMLNGGHMNQQANSTKSGAHSRATRVEQIVALILASAGFANTVAIIEMIRADYAPNAKALGFDAALAAIRAAENRGLIFRRVLGSVRRDGL